MPAKGYISAELLVFFVNRASFVRTIGNVRYVRSLHKWSQKCALETFGKEAVVTNYCLIDRASLMASSSRRCQRRMGQLPCRKTTARTSRYRHFLRVITTYYFNHCMYQL